jgi:transposase
MPAPIPLPVRKAIFQRWRKGETVGTLAEELSLSARTVRNLVRRFADRGAQGTEPDYGRCATRNLQSSDAVLKKSLEMRQRHPSWGAGYIRIHVKEELGVCPSERTLQRWFQQAALTPAPPGRRPSGNASRARRPHEVWQMDAAERITLGSGQKVSWLRVVDECSGAVLDTRVFPPGVLESGRAGQRPRCVAPDIFQVGKA